MLNDALIPPTHLLPYDLERTIIEYAAYMDRSIALKLLGLSREVKQWIEPILYRDIKLETSSQTDAFILALENPKTRSPDFFKSAIKSVSFNYSVTFHQAAKILSICNNLTSLSSWIELTQKTLNVTLDDIQDLGRFVLTRSPSLKRFSVTLQNNFHCPDPSFRAPVLQNLTHLSVFGGSEHFPRWTWAGFDALEYLTHFSFDIDTSTPLQVVYGMIPRFPPHLRVCLIVISAQDDGKSIGQYLTDNKEVQQIIAGDVDKRIVVGIAEQHLEMVDPRDSHGLISIRQWSDNFGDRDAWEKADGVVKTRVSIS